jgi:hypothetical protein
MSKKAAKDGGSDPMKEMRERYKRATDAERDNRVLALDDLRFVAVPGNQWDEKQKKARRNRPCYEFPILRAHWRQVVNDQKKARPGIKVRGLKDATTEGAELRQGIIRNVESVSKASLAYDAAHELLVATGFGAWRVGTEYSDDDGWDQDFCIKPIKDALNSVWADPDAPLDDCCGEFAFVEEMIPRETFKTRFPDAECVNFEGSSLYSDWYGKDDIRVAEYWRKVPVTKTVCLLSDGRSVSAEEYEPIKDELAEEGITCTQVRKVASFKVVSSLVSGAEELEEPKESVFHKIPIVILYANRHFIDGKWVWMGMVRPSRDPQKLLNYNFTAGQEALAKQHKSTPLVTPMMLEGAGVKAMWDASNAADAPYLPYTPDPKAPGGAPSYLTAPPIHNGFVQMGQMSIDMLKASDGIYDASVGARSNETSGVALRERKMEGDTATFDYGDKIAEGVQVTGELVGKALHKVYDTPRVVRVIGKDGAEDWKHLYEEVIDRQTGKKTVLNDLSAGKYDYTVTTGANYDTQRMEFVDMLVQLSHANPLVQQALPDLIVGSMDFPKADEAAERLKMVLPAPIQQAMAQKDQSPAVMQLQAQMQQMQQAAEQQMQEMGKALQQAQAKASSKDDAMAREINAAADNRLNVEKLRIDWFNAETNRMKVVADAAHAQTQQAQQGAFKAADLHQKDAHKAVDLQHQAQSAEAERQFQQQQTSGDSAAQ